ncbi:hypothetical protein O0L34_g4016 [Tuta absoluta]|nr:hypothetical protein O0L34_g4016 [Tuta absoluta]
MYYLRKGLDALLRVIGCGIGDASSRAAPRAGVRRARQCVSGLGAQCSISAAGTATPPDWAIHHRRPRPPHRTTPPGPPTRLLSRPHATLNPASTADGRVQLSELNGPTDALMPRRAQQRSRRIFKTDT